MELEKLITLLSTVDGLSYDGENYTASDSQISQIEGLRIPFEEYGDTLILKLKLLSSNWRIKYYEALESEITGEDLKYSLLIISLSGTIVLYDSNAESISVKGKNDSAIYERVSTFIWYTKLLNFFKTSPFCDYHNSANEQIVFYSSTHGIIRVTYDVIPDLGGSRISQTQVNEIISLASSVEVNPFLKNSLFVISSKAGIVSFMEIISKLDEIISITKRDYELVARRFSFDKFRDALYAEKEKFFKDIREVVNKIFSQAVGIPISISASVLATYKASDDKFMLTLILISFSIYSLYYVKIQTIYSSDLKEIQRDLETAFDDIERKSGLSKDVISLEKRKIQKKIVGSQSVIVWSVLLVLCLSAVVCIYILHEIVKDKLDFSIF